MRQFDPYHKWLGIPASEQPPNHYRLLGLSLFESDADAIESAADKQMAHLRTFQAGAHSADSQRLLNELAAAKLCLLSADRKAAYDAELQANQSAPFDAPDMSAPPIVTVGAPRRRPATEHQAPQWALRLIIAATFLLCCLIVFVVYKQRQTSHTISGDEQASGETRSPYQSAGTKKIAEKPARQAKGEIHAGGRAGRKDDGSPFDHRRPEDPANEDISIQPRGR